MEMRLMLELLLQLLEVEKPHLPLLMVKPHPHLLAERQHPHLLAVVKRLLLLRRQRPNRRPLQLSNQHPRQLHLKPADIVENGPRIHTVMRRPLVQHHQEASQHQHLVVVRRHLQHQAEPNPHQHPPEENPHQRHPLVVRVPLREERLHQCQLEEKHQLPHQPQRQPQLNKRLPPLSNQHRRQHPRKLADIVKKGMPHKTPTEMKHRRRLVVLHQLQPERQHPLLPAVVKRLLLLWRQRQNRRPLQLSNQHPRQLHLKPADIVENGPRTPMAMRLAPLLPRQLEAENPPQLPLVVRQLQPHLEGVNLRQHRKLHPPQNKHQRQWNSRLPLHNRPNNLLATRPAKLGPQKDHTSYPNFSVDTFHFPSFSTFLLLYTAK